MPRRGIRATTPPCTSVPSPTATGWWGSRRSTGRTGPAARPAAGGCAGWRPTDDVRGQGYGAAVLAASIDHVATEGGSETLVQRPDAGGRLLPAGGVRGRERRVRRARHRSSRRHGPCRWRPGVRRHTVALRFVGERRGRRAWRGTETFEIHPAIGIARAGNSAEFFVGPEPGGQPPAKYRDRSGRLLRQAARFRIFRCTREADGTLKSATELTSAEARVEWTVHVANRKGAAPEFPPTPARTPLDGGRLRNAKQTDRDTLVIDPGPRTLTGPGQSAAFDSGTFLGHQGPAGRDADRGRRAPSRPERAGHVGFVAPQRAGARSPTSPTTTTGTTTCADGPVTATVQIGSGRPVHGHARVGRRRAPRLRPGHHQLRDHVRRRLRRRRDPGLAQTAGDDLLHPARPAHPGPGARLPVGARAGPERARSGYGLRRLREPVGAVRRPFAREGGRAEFRLRHPQGPEQAT